MSRRRVYSNETLSIMERYFDTLTELADQKSLEGGLDGFCRQNGIDKRHFYLQRAERHRGFFETSWLLPLVKDYRVSPIWLLMGIGSKFV